jgi:hypothetical protein
MSQSHRGPAPGKSQIELSREPFYLYVIPEHCELVFTKDGRKAFAVVSPRSNTKPGNSFFGLTSSVGFDEAESKRPRMEIKTSSRQISSEKFSSGESTNLNSGKKSRSLSLDDTIYEEEETSSASNSNMKTNNKLKNNSFIPEA